MYGQIPVSYTHLVDENQFSVIFTVEQLITENGSTKTVRSAYEVTVYVDGSGNMVLTKNPTITSTPVKSGYTPKAKESDGTVDAVTTDEINEFLTTFFKLYPTATAKELSYYVNGGVLKPIGKDYVFSELVNPIYNRSNLSLIHIFMCQKTFDGKKPYGFLKSVIAYLVRPKLTYAGKTVKLGKDHPAESITAVRSEIYGISD